MNSKISEILEFNKIKELLREQAGSELTRKRIDALEPAVGRRQAEEALTETTEAVSVILSKGNIPVGEIGDVGGILAMASRGRILSMRELLQIRNSIQASRSVKAFLTAEDMPDKLRIIPEIAGLLEPAVRLEKDISEAIISEDEMSDSASPELRRIRRDKHSKNELIKARLRKMISSSSAKSQLQDTIVTMRNGRYVIPVKKEYVNAYPGMVHDQSSTGATLFIEPQAVVMLNNELKQLEMDEQAEIARILEAFSIRAAEHAAVIKNDQKLLVELDFFSAKGRLSQLMDGICPSINEEGFIDIKCGRHPLIDPKKVVPINAELGRDWRTLLITGPNTGGKTVTLKTIGLLCLMAQSGLHIPADERTSTPILREIYADIGDEQSIEQSLSTFSSHMKNIIEIFEDVGEGCLVLLDELGAGTDPLEGAALGIAELERLKESGALVAATTHYTELKKYALEAEGVENASMEFDVETLSPTYRLRVGLPGKSNAFEISRKLGLSEEIIERASELLGADEMEFEHAVSRVEEDKAQAEAALEAAGVRRAAADDALNAAMMKLEKAQAEADKIIEEAREKAREMLTDAESKIDEIAEELREIQSKAEERAINSGHISGGAAKGRKALREAKAALAGDSKPRKAESLQSGKPARAEQIKIGIRIKHIGLGQSGEVESLPDSNGNLKIRLGAIKMNANLKDLVIAESAPSGNKDKIKSKYANLAFSKSKTIRTEINLIGKNLDDAVYEMNKYIDDAFLAGLTSVHIIHGRGEGILKKGLREELKKNKHVKSFKAAEYNDGGEGCTVVELKTEHRK